jgi:hypothetical protein
MSKPLTQQMLEALTLFADQRKNAKITKEMLIKEAMVSGMSLVLSYQISNDGHPTTSPHYMNGAVNSVAQALGMNPDKIEDDEQKT